MEIEYTCILPVKQKKWTLRSVLSRVIRLKFSTNKAIFEILEAIGPHFI